MVAALIPAAAVIFRSSDAVPPGDALPTPSPNVTSCPHPEATIVNNKPTFNTMLFAGPARDFFIFPLDGIIGTSVAATIGKPS